MKVLDELKETIGSLLSERDCPKCDSISKRVSKFNIMKEEFIIFQCTNCESKTYVNNARGESFVK